MRKGKKRGKKEKRNVVEKGEKKREGFRGKGKSKNLGLQRNFEKENSERKK